MILYSTPSSKGWSASEELTVRCWLLHQLAVTVPIISANTPEQLADLLPAAQLVLSKEAPASLDEASVDA